MQQNAFLLIMEYSEGGSLGAALREDNSKVMWMVEDGHDRVPGRGRCLAIQICDAISYLHDNNVCQAQML